MSFTTWGPNSLDKCELQGVRFYSQCQMPSRTSNFIVFQELMPKIRAKYSWIDMKEILFLGQLSSNQGPRSLEWKKVPEI